MTREEFIHNENVAKDHSRVGVQAGQINIGAQAGQIKDNVFGATGQADLQDQLAELRRELLAARNSHELDAETFAAADEELSKAAEQSVDSSDGRSKLVIALKRLKGLVDGIADLGAKIAAIIAAIHSLR